MTGYLAKKLRVEHVRLNEFLKCAREDYNQKSIQNPEIYHKDILAFRNARNYDISFTHSSMLSGATETSATIICTKSKEISETDLIVDQHWQYRLVLKSEGWTFGIVWLS